jgi:hypothetical protein
MTILQKYLPFSLGVRMKTNMVESASVPDTDSTGSADPNWDPNPDPGRPKSKMSLKKGKNYEKFHIGSSLESLFWGFKKTYMTVFDVNNFLIVFFYIKIWNQIQQNSVKTDRKY